MNLRKILATALSFTIAFSGAASFSSYSSFVTFAEETGTTGDEELTYPIEVWDNALKYLLYEDYASLKSIESSDSTEVVIPSDVNGVPVTKIEGRAFSFSEAEKVSIPASVESIGDHLSGYAKNLKEIIVDPDNKSFCSMDGVVFTKDKKTLVAYPSGAVNTKYTVPNGVVKIGYGSFYTSNITEVTLPDSVNEIDSFGFAYCKSLVKIGFGNTIEELGYHSFTNCESLESVILPESISVLESSVFDRCNKLVSVTVNNPNCILGDNVLTLGNSASTVIHGYKGSTAEAYAEKYKYFRAN